MNKIPNKARGLSIRTKQIIGVVIIFFLVVVLPLFIWAILTQKFFFQKKAAVPESNQFSCSTDANCGCGLDSATGQCSIENTNYLGPGKCENRTLCIGQNTQCYPGCQNGTCNLICPPWAPGPVDQTPIPTPNVIPNFSTGKTCNQVCGEIKRTCNSIGTDFYAGNSYYKDGTSRSCQTAGFDQTSNNCDVPMTNQGVIDLNAKDQNGQSLDVMCRWSYCQCSSGTIPPTPTPTPTNPVGGGTPTPNPSGTPNSCGGTCGSDSNCTSGLVCYQGSCRNGFCPNSTNCSCTSPTPKPTIKPSGKASPTPTPTVTASATESPTPIATEIAAATPEITPTETPVPGIFNTLVNNYMIVLGGGLFVIVLLGLLIFMALRKKSKDNIPPINPPTTGDGPTQIPPINPPSSAGPIDIPPANFNAQKQTQMASMQEPPATPVTQTPNASEPPSQNQIVVPPTPENSS